MAMAFGFVIAAALLDIVANGFVSRSDGFKRKRFAAAAIVLVWGAFTLLSFAISEIELAVAYATWGALGIIGTATLGYFLNGDKLGRKGIAGMATIVASVIIMNVG